MISDAGLARLAIRIVSAASLVIAAGIATAAIISNRALREHSNTIGEWRRALLHLYTFIMSPSGIQRFSGLSVQRRAFDRFQAWLVEHLAGSERAEIPDYQKYRIASDPFFRKVAEYLASGIPGITGWQFEPLRRFMVAGLTVGDSSAALTWAASLDTRIDKARIWLLLIGLIVVAYSTVLAFLAEFASGSGITDKANVYSGAVAVGGLAVLIFLSGAYVVLLTETKTAWRIRQDRIVGSMPYFRLKPGFLLRRLNVWLDRQLDGVEMALLDWNISAKLYPVFRYWLGVPTTSVSAHWVAWLSLRERRQLDAWLTARL